MAAIGANAETYFFSQDGAGDMDGTSWENAAPSEYLPSTVENAEPGDCFYLMGGVYINIQDIVWNIPQGIKIIGGFPANSTGTNTDITYPTEMQSIFTADIDGDGAGDNGSNAFITINNTNAGPDKSNFQKLTLAGITIQNATQGPGQYKGSAMYVNNANIELDHVKVINNSTATKGGVCVFIGSSVYAHDCLWADNQSVSTGVAFLARQKGSGTDAGVPGSDIIMERCEFANNTVYEVEKATYGGALAMADNSGVLYMVNCTVTGSHIYWAGGMARIGGGVDFYGIYNSWYDCTSCYDVRHSGDILSAGTNSKVYVAANVAVTPTDGREGMMATNYIQGGANGVFEPYGYNVWGSLNDATATVLPQTNNIDKNNVTATVFGTNTLTDNGGFTRTIKPLDQWCNVPVSDIETLKAKWSLPEEIDLTVDQRGYTRGATTYVGAYDPNGSMSGVDAVTVGDNNVVISSLGNGKFSTSCAGTANVFDMTGRAVKSLNVEAGGVIDLSGNAKGLYIISINGNVKKVIND